MENASTGKVDRMTEELETVWNGTQGWGGGDRYLCIKEWECRQPQVERQLEPMDPEVDQATRAYLHRYVERMRVFKTLAARESWVIRDLVQACGLPSKLVYKILWQAHRRGTISKPSYGVVALVTRQVA